jgi:hypothetical protein
MLDFGDAGLLQMAGKKPVSAFVQFIFHQQLQEINIS